MPVKETLKAFPYIAGVGNEIDAFSQVAFIVRITATDRSRTRTTKGPRFLVFLKRAFRVEDFESGNTFQTPRAITQDAIPMAKGVGNNAKTILLPNFPDGVSESVRSDGLFQEQADHVAVIRQGSLFPNHDPEISIAGFTSLLKFTSAFDSVMVGEADYVELSPGRPQQPIELDVAVVGIDRVAMELDPQLTYRWHLYCVLVVVRHLLIRACTFPRTRANHRSQSPVT